MNVTKNALFKRVSYFTLAFVLAVSTLTAAVPFILSEKVSAVAPAVSISEASYVKDATYTGIYVGVNLSNVSTATALELRVNRDNGTPYSVYATQARLDIINASAAASYGTGGTVIVTGSRTSSSWTPQLGTWTGSSRPAAVNPVEVIVTLADGTVLPVSAPAITNNGATSAEVFATVPGDAEVIATNTSTGTTFSTLQAAFDAATTGQTVVLNKNINIAAGEKAAVIKSDITFDGNGHSITTLGVRGLVGNEQKNAALIVERSGVTVQNLTVQGISGTNASHGIIVFSSDNVTLKNIVARNNATGVVVSSSKVAINTIATSGNAWGGINVDKPGAVLTISGVNTHADAGTAPAIWVDNLAVGQVIDADSKYTKTNASTGAYYVLDAIAPTVSWQKQPNATYKTGEGFHVRPITGEEGLTKSVYVDSITPANLVRTLTSIHKNLDTTNANNQPLWDSLSDGTHKFIAVFTDAAGNSVEKDSASFLIDRTNPTVTVKTESTGNIAAGVFSNVSFKLFDAHQVDKVTINGVEKDLTNNNWSDLNGVKPGVNGAVAGNNVLVVYDVAGNATTFTFVLDNTAPTITLKAESLGGNGKYRNASFKLYDANKIDKVTVNGLVKDLGDSQWSDLNGVKPGVFGAIEGTNTIVVYDIAGNTTTYTLVLDITSPIATVSYSTTTATRNSVTAYLNTDEAIALPAGWTAVDASGTKFSKVYTENNANDSVSIADLAGNTASTTVAVTWIDKTAPVVVLDSLASFRVSGQVEIKGSVSDNFSFGYYNLSLYNATVDLSDGEAHAADRIATTGWVTTGTTPVVGTSATVSRMLDTTDLDDGSYQVRLAARDAAGNRTATDSVKYFTIVIDNTAPTTVSVVFSPATLTNQPVVATLTVSEAINTPSGWTSVEGSTIVFTKSYTANTNETVNYTDLAGNSGSASVAIDWIDTTPTEATVSYSTQAPTNQPVIATISTNEPIETPAGWTQVESSNQNFTKSYSENTTETVTITDLAGNTTEVPVSITWIDTTAPVITSATANGATTRGIVGFTVNDADATVRVNGVVTTASQVSGDGTYTVVATDTVGNVSTSFTFTINNAQAITFNTIDLETATPLITGTALWVVDPASVETVTVTIDGTPYAATIDAAGNWSVQVVEPLTNGAHTITVNGVSTTFTTALPTTFNAPAIVSPAAAVLGDATQNNAEQNNGSGETGVQGANTAQNLAAADTDLNKGLLFGLAWYWWILILAALTALAWWIIGAIRRRREEQN